MKTPIIEKLFGWTSGLASIAGLLLSIYPLYSVINGLPESLSKDLGTTFITLAVTIIILIISIACLNFYYAFKVNTIMALPLEAFQTTADLKIARQVLLDRSKSIHNILHQLRYILYLLSDFNFAFSQSSARTKIDRERMEKILRDFSLFMVFTLDNIKSHFDKLTGDDCSSCIKITHAKGHNLVCKTLHRDSGSYRSRKSNDFIDNKQTRTFPVRENTAFNIICSPHFKDTIFVSENLKERYDRGEYTNSNPQWSTHYNACLVVPISIIPDKKLPYQRLVVGFLCVDNFKGGFKHREAIDYLAGIGDILFPLLLEYDEFIRACKNKGANHEQIGKYLNWN
ncbi:MAG: hypothetical protein HS115_07060 [Spirochaetales bacterium]|nr:hypothetical protein [Spirochaetales bacterium]